MSTTLQDEDRQPDDLDDESQAAGTQQSEDSYADDPSDESGEGGDENDESGEPGSTPAEDRENNDLKDGGFAYNPEDDQGGSGKDGKRGGIRGLSGRARAGVTGGIATLVIGGGMGIFGIGQGPLKLLHAAQLLQNFHLSDEENFMDSRAVKVIRWAYTYRTPEKRNMGFWGNQIATRYQKKLIKAGITPGYNRSRRLNVLTFDTNNERALAALNEIKARDDLDFDIPDPDANGQVRVELPEGFGTTKIRRSILKGTLSALGQTKIFAAVSRRVMSIRSGVDLHPFSPLRNAARGADENFRAWAKERWEEYTEKYRKGAEPLSTDFKGADDEDGDGNRTPNETNNSTASDTQRLVDTDTPELKRQVSGLLTGGIGAATAATLICTLDQIGDSVPKVRHFNIILPLIRLAMDIIAMGNQIMAGIEVALEEVGAIVTRFYDEHMQKGLQEFFSIKSIKMNLGESTEGIADVPDRLRPNLLRPKVFQTIDSITGLTGISNVCGFVTSKAGGWIVDIADWGMSGGPAQAILAAAQDLLIGFAAGQFVDDLVNWLAGDPINFVDLAGGLLGGAADIGGNLLGTDSFVSKGAVPMSTGETIQWKQESAKIARAEFQQKSAFDRYLNVYDSRSLAGRAMIDNPQLTRPQSTVANFIGAPFRTLSSIFSNTASFINPKASAASTYDYGMPKFGFTVDEMDDPAYDDPFANAEYVEPRLEEFNERFGDCFGMVINPENGEINVRSKEGTRFDLWHDGKDTSEGNYSECNDETNEDLKAYRFYLADQFTVKAMVCYENLGDTCREVTSGIEEPDGSIGGGSTGPIASPGQDSSGIPCPADPDITDGGIGDKFGPGRVLQYRIHICLIRGTLDLNVSVTQNAMNMIRAAERDGVTGMSGNGYRHFDEQVALRVSNGCADVYTASASTCSPPTARPGTSNHESGEAIDVTCSGSIIRAGSACHNWLKAHAAEYGFRPLRGESWHWSVDGG